MLPPAPHANGGAGGLQPRHSLAIGPLYPHGCTASTWLPGWATWLRDSWPHGVLGRLTVEEVTAGQPVGDSLDARLLEMCPGLEARLTQELPELTMENRNMEVQGMMATEGLVV